MICVIALVVCGILGIFSVSQRQIAKEAFDCVFRKITLRKCTTGLDKRLKGIITGKVMSKNPRLAGFLHKRFEIISWAFTIMLILSMVYSVYGGYNFIRYGDCNGPEANGDGFCPFNILQGQVISETGFNISSDPVMPGPDDDPYIGKIDAPILMIEFGCYSCPYTAQAEQTVKQVLEKYGDNILFVYRDMPLSTLHSRSDLHSEAANCAGDQGRYWEYHDLLFKEQSVCEQADDHMLNFMKLAEQINLDPFEFKACIESGKYQTEVQNDFNAGLLAQIRGTPTFFINNHTITGPKPFAAFEKIIKEELKK